jgi:DNA primase
VISDATIRQVRDRANIQAVVAETVKLARRGRSYVGLCPFHQERSPSFHVTPERGVYHCFGCGEHGNAITFVMKTEGMTFPEAVRSLAERFGVIIEENASEQQRKDEQAQRKAREDLYAVGSLAALFFEKMLAEHPGAHVAREELERRALTVGSGEEAGPVAAALKSFRVGYAPAEWAGLATFLRSQGASAHVAEQTGLLLPRSSGGGYYDRFRNRLMFAVIDLQGRVVGFSGRILPDPQTGLVDKETGKYINSPETPIYRKGETVFGLFQARQAVRQAECAVIVEGNFDVVSLHARGIRNVVAPLGTAFTVEQATQVKRFCPAVTLLFDGDSAGRKAVRAAREPCKKADLIVKAAVLPQGMDPDDFCRTRGPEAMSSMIRSAKGLIEHLIAAALDESFVTADSQEKAARAKEVIEILSSEEDPTVRAMAHKFADDVAARLMTRDERTGMADATTFRALVRTIEAALVKKPASSGTPRPPQVRPMDPVLDEVLGALMDFPQLLSEPVHDEGLSYVDGDAVLVVAALRETGRADEASGLDSENFLAKVPPAFHSFALHRFAAPVHQDIDIARTQLTANLTKLKVRALSRENAIVSQEAAWAETSGDSDGALEMLRQIQERAQQKRRMRER